MRKAAGPGRSRRLRFLVLGLAGALLLVPAFWLLRSQPWGDSGQSESVSAALARLDRMALVFASRITERRHSSYFIDRFEVTNEKFADFVLKTNYWPANDEAFLAAFADPHRGLYPAKLADHPVVFVSHEDATAFASWAGKRLPLREEWDCVVGETRQDSRYYRNLRETGLGGTSRVGVFESGSTRRSTVVQPAVYDLMGNVWEWTDTEGGAPGTMLVVGGSFDDEQNLGTIAHEKPSKRVLSLGFRCVLDNAERIVRDLLGLMETSMPEDRLRIERALLRFGTPLAKLLHHIRFQDMVRQSFAFVERDDETVLGLNDGQIVVLGADGVIRMFDAANGTQLAELGGFGEFYHSLVADLDQDGKEELYIAVKDPDGWVPDRWAFDYPIVADWRGNLHLVDPVTNRFLPWCDGQSSLDDVLRASFELDQQFDPFTGAPLDGPWGTRGGFPTELCQPLVTPAGNVPRFHQQLLRIDPGAGQLRIVWEREMPYSPSLGALPGTGELLVPCVLYRLYGFETDEGVGERILQLRVVAAASGEQTATGLVAGGCQAILPLDREATRFLLATNTGHELLLHRDGSAFRVERYRQPEDSFRSLDYRIGPPPYSSSLAELDFESDRIRLTCFGGPDGQPKSVELATGGSYEPNLHVVPGFDGFLLMMGDDSLLCLNSDLSVRWRRPSLPLLDLNRSPPVFVDLDRDGQREFAMQWRLDGFLRLDPRDGEVIDRHQNPGPSLLRLTRARSAAGRDMLLVAVRDEGLYAVACAPSGADQEAVRLLDQLDPVPETR